MTISTLIGAVDQTNEANTDPPIASNFMLMIDGVTCSRWTECSGLGMKYGADDIYQGGQNTVTHLMKPLTIQTLTLVRPVGPASVELLTWFEIYEHVIVPLTAFVACLDYQDNILYWWELDGVTPASWSGPKTKSGDPSAVTETLVINYTDFLGYGAGSPGLGGAISAAVNIGASVVGALAAPTLTASAGAGGGGGSMLSNMASNLENAASALFGGTPQVPGTMTVQIVPQTLSISSGMNNPSVKKTPSTTTTGGNGQLQYGGKSTRKLKMKLVFDATTIGISNIAQITTMLSSGVQGQLDWLETCCGTTDSSGDAMSSPPTVAFSWGSFSFSGWLTELSTTVTIFRFDGTPLRAEATITITEITSGQGGQNPTSAALGATRTHRVVAGDSLPSISLAAYGRPDCWRAVADANGIDDPIRLPKGISLLLPESKDALAAK